MVLPLGIRPPSNVEWLSIIGTSVLIAAGLALVSIRRSSAGLLVCAIASPFLNGLVWSLVAALYWGAFRRFEGVRFLQFVFVTFGLGFLCFVPALLAVLLVQIACGKRRK